MKVVYTGIFLNDDSQAKLISKVSQHISLLDNVIAHHLTLKFRPDDKHVLSLPIGLNVSVTAVELYADDKAQAVVCTIPSSIECSNDNPHITLSVANGVPPVYSNTLIKNTMAKVIPVIDLPGRVGFFNGKEDVFNI